MTIAQCVIFKTPHRTFSTSQLGLLNRRQPSQAGSSQWHQAGSVSGLHWLNCGGQLHTSFHNAHNFRDCFRLFTQLRLWLTSRLRVNMQQQGARGVMVIVVGNGHSNTSSNPGRDPIPFHIALIPLGKVWIQLFSLQLWVNSRADWFLQPWWGN